MEKHIELTWIDESRDALVVLNIAKGKVVHANKVAKAMMSVHKEFAQWTKGNFQIPKAHLKCIVEKKPLSDNCRVQIIEQREAKGEWLIRLDYRSTSIARIDLLQLFEHNVAGIYETSLDGKLISFNEAFESFLGYSESELKNLKSDELYLYPKERAAFIKNILDNGIARNYELRYRRKDGRIAWCIENAFMSYRGDEKLIIGTLTDISEQKVNEDRFQSLFFNSGDAIFLIENDSVIKANRRCTELFGYRPEELLGKDIFALTGGLFHLSKGERELIETAINGNDGSAFSVCTISQRKDGSYFHCELTLNHFRTFSSSNLQIIVRDISERVLHEEAIRESEERFKLLSEVAIEGVVFVVNDKVRDCNQQFADLFGYKRVEELMNKSVAELVGEHGLVRLKETIDIKSHNHLEIRTKTRDGQVLFLEATGSTIEHRHEDIQVFLFYNITSRKRAELALEQSTERFKSLVEHSPNGIFILTNGRVRYVNNSGLHLLKQEEEDDIFDDDFLDFFHSDEKVELKKDLAKVRDGDSVEQKEYKLINSQGDVVVVGLKATLTVYDSEPSIQVTLNNLNMRMKLMQETLRAQIAEEINVVLKKEIEEHKLTQKKLREAENFTRNIIQSSIDMIIALDNNGLITEFNLAAQKQFGYKQNQIIGKPASLLYDRKEDYEYVTKSISENKVFSGEIENVKKDGTSFTSYLSASIIKNDEGEPVGSMGVSRDVTELRKAEQELRDSEERYRDLFENATDFIFSVDKKGKFLYANRAFLDALGYESHEILKLKLESVVNEMKKGENIFDHFAGKTRELELKSRRGKTITVYGDSTIRYSNGKPDSIRAIFRDITDLRKHEQAALQQAAKLESIFNSTENMMMWTLDLNGVLNSFNNNFQRWCKSDFDYQPQLNDVFLELMTDWLDKDVVQGEMKHFQEAFTGKAQEFELPILNKDGERIWFQVFVNPVRVKDRMEEVSCLAYDITDRKEIDQKILASLKEKEVLLQEVHHRVKNNLQVISSILNLQSSFVTDEKVLSVLKESQSRIKTMSYIHETLYQTADFSSIEFTEYISTLARNLVQSYAPGNTRVHLETDFDEIFLNLDQAIPCGLIINELVSNSLKYAFTEKNEGKLKLSIKQNDKFILMRVEDNGVGLPAGFNFEESESLGLYLVHALIEQLDAKMEINSQSGTSFLITFEKQ